MDRSVKRIGLVNCIALLAATAGMLLIARYVNSAAGLMGAILGGLGLLVALLSYCQMSLEGREQLEKLEMDELSKSRGPPRFSRRRGRTHSRRGARANNSNGISFRR